MTHSRELDVGDLHREVMQLAAVVGAPHLEPDPSRHEWEEHAAELDLMWTIANDRIRVALDEIDPDEVDPVAFRGLRARCADVLGETAAVLHIAGRTEQATELLQLACAAARGLAPAAELAEAVATPDRWTLLVHARWLHDRGESNRARVVAQRLRGAPSPAIASAAKTIASARRWKIAAIAISVVTMAGFGVVKYRESESYRLDVAIEEAQQLATDDPDAAIDRYQQILEEFPNAAAERQREIVEAVVQLASADVPSPVGVDDIAAIERVVYRVESLPSSARGADVLAPLVERLETWASEIGEQDHEATLAQLDVLALAEPLAAGSTVERIRERRTQLARTLADELASEWPIEAIRLYAALGPVDDDMAAAGRLLDALDHGPSVWIELAPDIETWASNAARRPALAEVRARALARLEAAREAVADPDRARLLEDGDATALLAHLAAHPGDQDVAVALAQHELSGGDPQKAIGILEALGRPGERVLVAQLASASAYDAAGRTNDAVVLLERALASRFPAFRGARRAFRTRFDALESQLIAQAEQDRVPEPWASRFRSAREEEIQRIFSDWLDEEAARDGVLSSLRERYAALSDIVAVATQLGTMKLTLAQEAEGQERDALLTGAERAFLSIASEGRGATSYHVGLGTVYFRLGRDEEGEREFAELMAGDDPWATLAVGHAYRKLGKEARARDVASALYDAAKEDAIRHAAASLMALLADGFEDQEVWLGRADPTNEHARIGLLEVRGQRLLLEGDLAGADAEFASAASSWAERAETDNAAANNGALALRWRYQCTGDVTHLRDSRRLLERAVRLNPDDPIVFVNLADALAFEASLAVLDRWIDTASLRLSLTEARLVLDALMEGDQREAVIRALQASPLLRKSMEAYARHRTLAPKSPAGYSDVPWLVRLEDSGALAMLAEKLEQSPVDTEAGERTLEKARSGEYDERWEKHATATIDRLRHARAAAEKRNDARTVAATWLLEADALLDLTRTSRDPSHAREAVDALRNAGEGWPSLASPGHSAAAWLRHAALELRTKNDAFEAIIEDTRVFPTSAILVAAIEDPSFGSVLASHPSFAHALEAARGTRDEELSGFDWMIGKLANDAGLMDRAVVQMRSPLSRASRSFYAFSDRTGLTARMNAVLPPLQ